MVQSDSEAAWPELSPRLAIEFRRCAEAAVRTSRPGWAAEVSKRVLSRPGMEEIAEDPHLAAMFREGQVATTLHWTVSNIAQPGKRVPVVLNSSVLASIRYLVRRGRPGIPRENYHASQFIAWRKWMEVCFQTVSDADDLRVILDVSALSFTVFSEDYVAAVTQVVRAESADLLRGGQEQKATVNLLLEGAPIARSTAEATLGYRLLGPHTAAVVWSDVGTPAPRLQAAAEALREIARAPRQLTIVAGADVLWIWLPLGRPLDDAALSARLAADSPGVRMALGRPEFDVEGFRRSHLHALATQRMMARLTSPQQLARHHDVQLTAALTHDMSLADEFLHDTLGDLAAADPETREVLLTFIRQQCNASRTAEVLFTHRNTVNRRLAAADEIMPHPLADNLVNIAAALEVMRWRGGEHPA